MFVAEFLVAIACAVLIILILGLALGRRGPWPGLGWFFLVVFLGAWAVGTWTVPIGPTAYGVAWVPFVFGASILALMAVAMTEPRRGRDDREDMEAAEAVAIGGFFWLLVGLLVGIVLIGISA